MPFLHKVFVDILTLEALRAILFLEIEFLWIQRGPLGWA